MNSFKSFLLFPILAFSLGCSAQSQSRVDGIKNAKNVAVRIDGDCDMCKARIDKVGSVKGEATVVWDTDAKTALVTFDSTRTDLDAILQRVAHAGYDNERYLAPKEAYEKLPGCCQYERTMVHAPLKGTDAHAEHTEHAKVDAHADHGAMAMEQDKAPDHLAPVYDAYFILKDALVASDAKAGKSAAQELGKALAAVDMGTLDHEVHMVWMNVMGPLADRTKAISTAKDVEAQRKAFMQLTDPMAQLAKAAPLSVPIYRDHCPMYEGGADWLSTEKPIKNPFYGSMMMTCGSVKETIAK